MPVVGEFARIFEKALGVEIGSKISYTNLRYTFDKSAKKIDERVLLPFLAPMLRFAISFSWSNLYSETPHENLPDATVAKQLDRSMKKTTWCKKATGLPAKIPSLIGQRKKNSGQSAGQISTTSYVELV